MEKQEFQYLGHFLTSNEQWLTIRCGLKINAGKVKVEYIYPLLRDDIVILIPVKFTVAELFYFNIYAYGIAIVTILVLFIYFNALKSEKSLFDVFLIYMLVCTGKPIKETNVKYFRIIYMSMMVVGFYGYTLLSIQILSALALQPSEMTINTVEQFSQTDYKIITGPGLKTVLTESINNTEMGKRILSRIETPWTDTEAMAGEEKLLQNCSEYAVICKRSTFMYYMDLSYIQGKMFCYKLVPEAIVPSLVTFILGYRSPFQQKFNEIFGRIIQHGLIANYTNQVVKEKTTITDEVKPFGMRSKSEMLAWNIYGIGILTSCFVFFLELTVFPYCEAYFNKLKTQFCF